MKDKKNSQLWQVLEEQTYAQFPIFSVRRSRRVNPRTGTQIDFLLMSGLDWANVIALTDNHEVVLVRQYRHGADAYTLETPGGCVEAHESPLDSVRRELQEETGYCVKDIQPLGVFHPNAAMQSMRCHCFVAFGAHVCGPQTLDDGECIEVLCKPLYDVKQMILGGVITHSIVLASFAMFFLREKELLRLP